MTNPKVWVSATGNIAVGVDGPGPQWEQFSTIDIAEESDMWKHIETHIGARAPVQISTVSTCTAPE
jgi:hypothetical protein